MATNLTTIEVRLIANAQKFKKDESWLWSRH